MHDHQPILQPPANSPKSRQSPGLHQLRQIDSSKERPTQRIINLPRHSIHLAMKYCFSVSIVSSVRAARSIVSNEAVEQRAPDTLRIDMNTVLIQLLQKYDT
jgi:hypothetical protein